LVIDDCISSGYPGIVEAVFTHAFFRTKLIPVCFAFNKGVFIYNPSKAHIKGLISTIANFATVNKYVFRKSDKGDELVIFERSS
jgi:hypothetical protein